MPPKKQAAKPISAPLAMPGIRSNKIALSQAVQSAFALENLASIISGNAQQKQQDVTQDASGLVGNVVEEDVIAIRMNTAKSGTEGALVNTDANDPRPQNLFTSVSVPLTSRVSSKLKAKNCVNEFMSFGTLLFDSLRTKGNTRY